MRPQAVQHGAGGMGVGLHEGLGTGKGVADGLSVSGFAARRDTRYHHQQQDKEGKRLVKTFHASTKFCREDTAQQAKMQE